MSDGEEVVEVTPLEFAFASALCFLICIWGIFFVIRHFIEEHLGTLVAIAGLVSLLFIICIVVFRFPS